MKKLVWAFFWITIATAVLLFAQTTVNTRTLRLTASPTVQPCSFSLFGLDVTNKATWFCDAGTWFRAWAAPGPPTLANQVILSSAAGAAAWGQVNSGASCGDATHAVNFTAGTGFGCQTLSGGGSGALTLISSLTPSGTGVATFTAITSAYTDLVLVVRGRSTAAATGVGTTITFNSDTGANYDSTGDQINNVDQVIGGANASGLTLHGLPAANAPAGASGYDEYTIYLYSGSTFFKTVFSMSGQTQGSGQVNIYSQKGYGQWRNTASVTRIDATLTSGNFVAGSTVSLYGRS